jgi:zinc protease
MIKKVLMFLPLLGLVMLSSKSNAQMLGKTELVEKVDAKPGQTIIPYSKYKLPNGLTLIVHEDKSDPLVHVEVTYHVGSNRELPGRSGFAHFFEHMMFQGSEHVADEEHFKVIQGAGGNMNGTTNRDRTNYYQTIPSNMLETVLFLESDRMGYLPNAFTEDKFEVQRKTVKNEKAQNYGVPYGFVGEVKDQLLYPEGHPYSWPIIGFTDDLDKATKDDLNAFFLRYYGPNNAIVAVSGDVNTDEVVKLVEKYFGSIPRGPEVAKMVPPIFRLPESKFKTEKDDIYLPLTMMVYPTVPNYHRDEPALDILADLLAGNRSSLFYKNFIKAENALQASVSHPAFELGGEFTIAVVTYPFQTSAETRKLIMKTLEEFEQNSFTEEELEISKESFISNFYSTLESNASKASTLTQYHMLLPNKEYNIDKEIERYRKVSKNDILRVFRQYIKDKNYACLIVERDPILDQPGAKKQAFTSFNPYANYTPDYSEFKALKYNRPVEDFDRKIRPVIPPAKPVVVPDYYKFQTENGIKFIGTGSEQANRILFYISIDGGQLFEDGKKFPFGTAFMTGAMLNESTQKYPSAELEAAMNKIGSSISFSGNAGSINGTVMCYKDKIKETMEILEQMLLFPNFERTDFNLLKKQLSESVANQRTNPNIVASKAFSKLLYGDNNPLGKYTTGNFNDFNKITLEHVSRFYQSFFSPHLTNIVVVGNIEENAVKEAFSFLKNWEKKNIALPTFANFPQYNKSQIFMVNRDNAQQSQIVMGHRAFTYDAYGDFFKANVMNFVLGGNFNSRLNLTIREDKGWTYGINSYYTPGLNSMPGYYAIQSGIKSEKTDSALMVIMEIVNNYKQNGITEEELSFTKSALVSSDALRYETSFSKANFLSTVLSRNLDKNYREKQAQMIGALTKSDIDQYAKNYLKPENMVIVIVGSQATLKERLEGLGYGKIQTLNTNAEGKIKIYK